MRVLGDPSACRVWSQAHGLVLPSQVRQGGRERPWVMGQDGMDALTSQEPRDRVVCRCRIMMYSNSCVVLSIRITTLFSIDVDNKFLPAALGIDPSAGRYCGRFCSMGKHRQSASVR